MQRSTARVLSVLVFGVVLGLGLGPAPASAQDITPNVPTTVPHSTGVVPGQVAALASKVSTDQAAIYAYLAWDRGIWEQVHICEEPDWVNAGGTSDGYFEGGLGISASLYDSYAGHSSNLDSPDQQVYWARFIVVDVGHGAWASCARAWLDQLPY